MARAVVFVHLDVSIARDTMLVIIVQNHLAVFTSVLALYDPFGVDVPLNFDMTHSLTASHKASDRNCPMYLKPPPRSVVVRASARGAGGRGSIPDRVTPKT